MYRLRNLTTLRDSPHHLRMLLVFAVASFMAIFGTSVLLAHALGNYISEQMMRRDAVVSTEMLNSIVRVEQASGYLWKDPDTAMMADTAELFAHVARLPDVFRANVYNRDGEIVWSSDEEMIGQTFDENEELALAMQGRLDPELSRVDRDSKEEHVGFPEHVTEFLEFYIPIWSADGSFVVGAAEVYKAPEQLLGTISHLRNLVWFGGLIASVLLFAALSIVVAYTTRILHRQEQRLVETEKLAVVGEMASAVAHGLRNPLAAIRSCAELVAEDDLAADSRQTMRDIVEQVDRLEAWIRSFLIRARSDGGTSETCIGKIVHRCLRNFEPQLKTRGIAVELAPSPDVPVRGEAEIEQVLSTLVANAIEAMKTGGTLSIGWERQEGEMLALHVTDTGPGLDDAQMARLFRPFQTTKSSGLGVGLALGRRIAERLGGALDLRNGAERGVVVTLTVPAGG